MLKAEYNKLLDWLEDFISSGQADQELGKDWEEKDLVDYLKHNFEQIWDKVSPSGEYSKYISSINWEYFYTLFFKKQKYIIKDNVLIEPCLTDLKKADDIPDTVQKIGANSFNRNRSLISVKIPEGVTTIEEWAFSACKNLKIIKLPNTLKNIERYAFDECSNLTNITIPDSVIKIGKSAFSNCVSLTNITIPHNITSIEKYTFMYCDKLSIINIPNSVKSIKEGILYYCPNLKTINFNGTKQEWKKIKKEVLWYDRDSKIIKIHSTDGDLEI